AGAATLPATSRFVWADSYPTRPVAFDRWVLRWWSDRHPLADSGRMATTAIWATIHCRKSGRGWNKYRHREGREGVSRRLYVADGNVFECHQRNTLRSSQF